MIKKLRIRFIRISMLSICLVLLIIMGAINIINYRRILTDSDRILTMLQDNGGSFPDLQPSGDGSGGNGNESGNAPAKNSTPAGSTNPAAGTNPGNSFWNSGLFGGASTSDLSAETPFETRYFTVTLDKNGKVVSSDTANIAAVDEETASDYATSVFSSSSDKGFSGYYRYLKKTTDGQTLIIFLDCQKSLSNFYSFFLTSLLVSAAGVAAVFILVLLLSKKVTQPAEESYQKQKQFITDAGHELKTPLTIIDADVSVMEMDTGENEWLDDVKSQTKRLASLTNDLIYLSRMDEGKSHLQKIDFPISDIISDTAQSFRSRSQVAGKTFTCSIEPMLNYCGDEKSIQQLVSILLDNAIKYSDEHGSISLKVRKKGKNIEIQVSNSVDNIDTETISHMFDRFYRADKSRNSASGGYGIGLSIARSVVQAHKGRIQASCEDGRSLTITCTL